MLHKQTPTARMFVNADEFIKKKIYQTTWNWQLRSHLDNCAWALVKAGYVIGIVHSTFGIFSSPQYIMFMFSFSRFFRSVTLWCFLSLILSDEDKIELAVINPAYVMGPVINGSMSTSSEVSRSTKQKNNKLYITIWLEFVVSFI